MQILVRNDLTLGSFGRTSVLVVKPTDTIYSIMAKMEDITGVPPIQQRMIVNCKTMLQKKTLKALGIAIVDDDDSSEDDDDDDYSEDDDDDEQSIEEEETVRKMRMVVTDYMIPGPARRTVTLEVEAGDMVASVMEQVSAGGATRWRCSS
ncbi:unnamed protein product [Urochloa humidicola]